MQHMLLVSVINDLISVEIRKPLFWRVVHFENDTEINSLSIKIFCF